MVIIPLLFASLFSLSCSSAPKNAATDFKSYLVTEANERGNYTLTGIKNTFTEKELRIYKYDDLLIDEVKDDAFVDTTFSSLMLSKCVTHITNTVFDNATSIKKLYYTGSETEYNSLELTHSFTTLSFYSKDEGFINYWNQNIRPEASTNICDISKDTFNNLYSLYKNLSDDDLKVVDAYVDLGGAKINDSMKQLIKLFSDSKQSQKKDEWNQTGAITLIIFIAVLGMTSITIFFLLKTKHLID